MKQVAEILQGMLHLWQRNFKIKLKCLPVSHLSDLNRNLFIVVLFKI